MIFSREIRAARALLGWSQVELAAAAAVGVATVRRLETAGTEIRGSVNTVWKIQRALENAGIEFIPAEAGRGGPGVRLRQG
jgi:transcriptional regulator with XRE-family HTH domain